MAKEQLKPEIVKEIKDRSKEKSVSWVKVKANLRKIGKLKN